MGGWSKYPDGNDYNIDLFAYFISQYFEWQETKDNKDLEYDPKNPLDPGLDVRMGLRSGGSPKFSEDDLMDDCMDAYLTLLKSVAKSENNEDVVGLGISLARVLNNEDFGIFIKTLPEKNLLSDEIRKYLVGLTDNEEIKSWLS